MTDMYRMEDIVSVSLAILVIGLIPVAIWAAWMAKNHDRVFKKVKKAALSPPPPPVAVREGHIMDLITYPPEATYFIRSAQLLEFRMHRLLFDAKSVVEQQRIRSAIEVLRGVSPECVSAFEPAPMKEAAE